MGRYMVVPLMHAERVKRLRSFNGSDGWRGTVYHLVTADDMSRKLCGAEFDFHVSVVSNSSTGVRRVYGTDAQGNQLNIDGTAPDDAVDERTGLLAEKPVNGSSDAMMLEVLFSAVIVPNR